MSLNHMYLNSTAVKIPAETISLRIDNLTPLRGVFTDASNNLISGDGNTGAKGDTGAQGPTGPKGDTGAAGSAVAKGDTGAQGIQGNTGPTGSKGDTGAAGSAVAKGDTGAQGAKGDTGSTGSQGATGTKGDTGAAGSAVAKGDTGAQGIQGNTGATGAQGVTGTKGDTGNTGAKGDTGSTGARGSTGPQGTAADNTAVLNQGTNISTTVVSNTKSLQVLTQPATAAAGSSNLFLWESNYITANSVVLISINDNQSSGGRVLPSIATVAEGSCIIVLTNIHATTSFNGSFILGLLVI